jgi:hypothetical protein
MTRKPHDDTPRAKDGRALVATPEDRAKHRRRATEVETADPSKHPTDQAYKGTLFSNRLKRPIGRGELKARRRRGQPWTPELIEDVVAMLEEGLFFYHVETLLGLSDRKITNTLYIAGKHERAIEDWDQRAGDMSDADAEAELGPRPDVTPEMEFAARVKQSETLGEMTLFGAIINAALDGDTKAAQWMLERKKPMVYGSRAVARVDLQMETHESGNASEAGGENARAQLESRLTAMRLRIEAESGS